MQEQELEFTLDQQMDVFGVQDSNAKLIENALSVSINARNSHVEILGDSEQAVQSAVRTLKSLRDIHDRKEKIDTDVVYRVLESIQAGEIEETMKAMSDVIVLAH